MSYDLPLVLLFSTMFSIEIFVYQFFLFYIFYICYNSKNIFYTLLYTFISFFFMGLFLAFWQVDLFTGFLWVLEITIIFVFLLVLFYLNFKGYINKLPQNNVHVYKFIFFLFYIVINFIFYKEGEFLFFTEINFFTLWENFYESVLNFTTNDFSVFLLSYYYFNSIEFIFLGVILFIGSVVCINLYKINKNDTIKNSLTSLTNFNFFTKKINFNILRKQNLNIQSTTIPSTKMVTKN